ncbi:hypothetical protein ACFX1Z_037836 [Malus domestica]
MKLSRLPASDSPQSYSLSTCGIILINVQAQFQHRVNSPGKVVGVIKAETRGQKTSVIEQQHMVLSVICRSNPRPYSSLAPSLCRGQG